MPLYPKETYASEVHMTFHALYRMSKSGKWWILIFPDKPTANIVIREVLEKSHIDVNTLNMVHIPNFFKGIDPDTLEEGSIPLNAFLVERDRISVKIIDNIVRNCKVSIVFHESKEGDNVKYATGIISFAGHKHLAHGQIRGFDSYIQIGSIYDEMIMEPTEISKIAQGAKGKDFIALQAFANQIHGLFPRKDFLNILKFSMSSRMWWLIIIPDIESTIATTCTKKLTKIYKNHSDGLLVGNIPTQTVQGGVTLCLATKDHLSNEQMKVLIQTQTELPDDLTSGMIGDCQTIVGCDNEDKLNSIMQWWQEINEELVFSA